MRRLHFRTPQEHGGRRVEANRSRTFRTAPPSQGGRKQKKEKEKAIPGHLHPGRRPSTGKKKIKRANRHPVTAIQ